MRFYCLLFLLLSIPLKGMAQDDVPILTVLTDLTPPYTYQDKDGVIKGERVAPIRQFLDKTGLKYKFQLVPWNRAFTSAKTRKNILIFDLDRTSEREDLFQWILPLKSNSYQLITRNSPKMRALTKKEIIEGNYKALCEQNTLTCNLFREYGFPEDRIIQFSEMKDIDLINFIILGRADFIIGSFRNIGKIQKEASLPQNKLVPILEDFKFTTYLAGSKNMDPRIKNTLIKTSESYPTENLN